MTLKTRQLIRIFAVLAVAATSLAVVQAAGADSGSVGLARGVLETQAGFSSSRAVAWTTGVCSYADKPSSCYLTPKQAIAQAYAEAKAMGAPPLRVDKGSIEHAASIAGDIGLARSILETQFGFSPGLAAAWTTGACSYGDNPSTCYLTGRQTLVQYVTPPVTGTASVGFQWGDAGIGAGATVGLMLVLAGLGVALARSRGRHAHA